jgi:hypothetical protein
LSATSTEVLWLTESDDLLLFLAEELAFIGLDSCTFKRILAANLVYRRVLLLRTRKK